MKLLKKILIALGVLSCLYGGIVMALVSSSHWFNYAGVIVGGVLIAAGICLEFLDDLRRKTPRLVRIIILVIIAAVVVHFACFEAKVIGCANSSPSDNADYVIVLGAKVNGTVPSLEFQKRIDAALEYGLSHKGCVIICTGGMGNDEDIPESRACYNYLLSEGIEEYRLFKEEKSTSTSENFLYAKEQIALSTAQYMSSKSAIYDLVTHYEDLKPSNVLVVSSSFHLYRASLIAQKQGYDVQSMSFLGSKGRKILMPHYYLREYAAYVRELLF